MTSFDTLDSVKDQHEVFLTGLTVSKNGFYILDSDLHVIEPGDLFTRYIDPEFSDQAPTLGTSDVSAIDTWLVNGQPFPYWGQWPEFHNANQRLREKKQNNQKQKC